MKYITVDLSGISSRRELHDYLKTVFELPEYYGRNMDALWDAIQCRFPEETTIVLKNTASLPDTVRRQIPVLLGVFSDLERTDENVTVVVESDDPSPEISMPDSSGEETD